MIRESQSLHNLASPDRINESATIFRFSHFHLPFPYASTMLQHKEIPMSHWMKIAAHPSSFIWPDPPKRRAAAAAAIATHKQLSVEQESSPEPDSPTEHPTPRGVKHPVEVEGPLPEPDTEGSPKRRRISVPPPSPKTPQTPKTPKTPKTPASLKSPVDTTSRFSIVTTKTHLMPLRTVEFGGVKAELLVPVTHIVAENMDTPLEKIGLSHYCSVHKEDGTGVKDLFGRAALAHMLKHYPLLKIATPLLPDGCVALEGVKYEPILHWVIALPLSHKDTLDLIRFLLAQGVPIDSIEPTYGTNILHAAIKAGKGEVAVALHEALIKDGSPLAKELRNAYDTTRTGVLGYAAYHNQFTAADHFAAFVIPSEAHQFTDINTHGYSPLSLAAAVEDPLHQILKLYEGILAPFSTT